MAMYNRTRDHSAQTAAFIRGNLKHADDDCREFAAWQQSYQEFFEADFTEYTRSLDGVITLCRRVTAAALGSQAAIENAVSAASDAFVARMQGTNDLLRNYTKVLGALKSSISMNRGTFTEYYNVDNLRARLAGLAGSDYLLRMEFRRSMTREFGFDARCADTMWQIWVGH